MPARMKVCSTPGCPELTRDSRCSGCERGAERRRGSSSARGYDAAWRRTRDAYLDAHPICSKEFCLTPATEVDHKDGEGPLGPRGHDWSNLRQFCKSHHSARTARDQPGGWNVRG